MHFWWDFCKLIAKSHPIRIKIEQDLCHTTSLTDVCHFVFKSHQSNSSASCQAKEAIIATTEKTFEEINSMMARFPGNAKKYKSCNTVNNKILYPVEFIKKLTISGFPTHITVIKGGRPIMLLLNLDPQNGHCNGKRHIVTQLHIYIIEAQIATSNNMAGRTVFIQRITHVTQENEYPFEMRRKQFPIKSAFAVTTN